LQSDAVAQAGAGRVFTDEASGARDDRPGLADAPSHLRPGDVLIVWRLDRLGLPVKEVAESLGVNRAMIYRALGLGAAKAA
jgi:DNA invertase Pin-like site-specific DNA recombinase